MFDNEYDIYGTLVSSIFTSEETHGRPRFSFPRGKRSGTDHGLFLKRQYSLNTNFVWYLMPKNINEPPVHLPAKKFRQQREWRAITLKSIQLVWTNSRVNKFKTATFQDVMVNFVDKVKPLQQTHVKCKHISKDGVVSQCLKK